MVSALCAQRRAGDSYRRGPPLGSLLGRQVLAQGQSRAGVGPRGPSETGRCLRGFNTRRTPALRFTHMEILRTLTQAGLLAHWLFTGRVPKPQRRPVVIPSFPPAAPSKDLRRTECPPARAQGCSRPVSVPDEGRTELICRLCFPCFCFSISCIFFFSSCCSFLTFMLFVHFTFSLSLPTSECLLLSVRLVSSSSLFGPF